jgi:phosphatidylglycerol:prolipoprotein diacylglycerol transferase
MMYPFIDPVAFWIGGLAIRWYSLAYLVGFLWVLFVGKYLIKQGVVTWISKENFESLISSTMLAVVAGGRVFYILFYQFYLFLENPLVLFKIWQGGMSFHGGVLGGVLFLLYKAKKIGVNFLQISDLILPWVPLGLGLGRLANFVNGELWGRPTAKDWGVVFPWVDDQLRHPSQLYEFFLEGVVLSVIMYVCWRKLKREGAVTGVFLFFYGAFRIAVEFFRSPDHQLGLLFNLNLTMGQCLSIPMILLGVYFFYNQKNTKKML